MRHTRPDGSNTSCDSAAHLRPLRLILTVGIVIAVVLELSGRMLYHVYGASFGVSNTMTLLAVLCWVGVSVYVVHQLRSVPWVIRTVYLGATFLVLSPLLSSMVYFGAPVVTGLLDVSPVLYHFLEEFSFLTGLALLFAGFYISLFVTYESKTVVEQKRQVLAQEVEERKRAEAALKDIEAILRQTNASLESHVEERTVALTESNRQLNEEMERRIKTEESLHMSEMKYRAIVENSVDRIWQADLNLVFTYINPTPTPKTRFTPAEVIGRSLAEFVAPEAFERFNEMLARALRKESHVTSVCVETEGMTRTGAHESIEVRASILVDAARDPIGIQGITRDITERKRAEAKMAQAAQDWQRTFDATNHAIWILDKHHHILRSNQASERLFNHPCSELLGMHCWDIVHGTEKAISNCPASRARESLHRETMEVQVGVRWFEIVVDPIISAAGQYDGAVHIINEITERKQSEAERARFQEHLLQTQKIESIGRLAGGVAHDFNNMLGVILGRTELALAQPDLPESARVQFRGIQSSVQRSTNLTRQLLAFARRQVVSPQLLNVNTTVSGLVDMLQTTIGENIRLHWKPAAALWPVKMDAGQLDQIMVNLCINARDAIDNSGHVTIETKNSVLDDACLEDVDCSSGEYVQITVSDTGMGMDNEVLSHIFEPFYTTKGMGKGVGLGLAAVYGIVRQHGGLVRVSSEQGGGAVFTIYLPRCEGVDEIPMVEAMEAACVYDTEMVLLVEDDLELLELASAMLEQQGYRVLLASTAGEAERLAKKYAGEIDLLLTDVILPEMNGRELADRLSGRYPKMKRVFMSGYPTNVIAHSVLAENVHFIQKPFLMQELVDTVRGALDQE